MAIKDWLRSSVSPASQPAGNPGPVPRGRKSIIFPAVVPMLGIHAYEASQIDYACFDDPWPESAFRHNIASPHHCKFVALFGGQVIGYAIFATSEYSHELVNLAVHPNYQRQRVGWRLIAHQAQLFRHNPKRCILAPVSERNVDAQHFFRKCGFNCISIATKWFNDGSDAYVFQLRADQKPLSRCKLIPSDWVLSRAGYLGKPVTR